MGYLGTWLPVVWSGVALVGFAPSVLAKTPAEISAVAKAVTVKIEHSNDIGTGVIVHKQGQVYSLVTNRHVVCDKNLCNQLPPGRQYRLSLPDGQKIQVSAKNIQLLGQDLDLAVIQFTSSQSYSIVKLEELGKLRSQSKLRAQDAVFTAGFSGVSRQFEFGQGEAIAVVDRRIQGDRGGYSIVYNSPTLPGMSGGGVFNQYGELVAIHGQGDKYKSGTEVDDNARVGEKIGLNRGIPIRWLVQGLGEKGIMVGERSSLSATNVSPAQAPKVADEYFIAGFNKFVDPGTNITTGKREAIGSFTKAIQLNSRYFYAYYVRSVAYYQIGEFKNALADCNKAISLQESSANAFNPNLAGAYYNRGFMKDEKLNDSQGALADYNKAITLNPKYVDAYINRGNLKAEKLNDFQGALTDYNQAVALNPKLIAPYYNRGVLRQVRLNDFQGALSDYNQVISLNPNYGNVYISRGNLKVDALNDPQGALADYNQAISLNPNSVLAYYNRGNLKVEKLNDPLGALADLNKAISLQPNYADAYINRGVLKANRLNDPQGALADLNRAISLHESSANALKPNLVNAYTARGIIKATKLTDRPGGIADLRQAARLARAQGQTQILQSIIEVLNYLGATE